MIPEAFLKRMKGQLGEEYPDFLKSYERPRAVALRFNPLKVEKPLNLSFVQENVPWEENGFYYDPDSRPGLHPLHEAGAYYLQEASAMSAVALLDPQPGETICDLCAAPGGKTTQIAGRMKGEGLLLCNEIHPKRAKILSQNIERLGVGNAVVTNEKPKTLSDRLPAFFDRVLVDAPCSGEGMFRKEEAAITDWSQETVEMCADRQTEILECAAQMVRPGGVLVYSTCTFAPEEDEEMIASFLEKHAEFTAKDVNAPWFDHVSEGCYRIWPHKVKGEGHFAAFLVKEDGKESETQSIQGQKKPKELDSFLKEMSIELPSGKLLSFGQTLYWTPENTPVLDRLKVLRPGLELGELKKGRFEPAHALAMWAKSSSSEVDFSAEESDIRKYLHGDVIASDIKGWCLVKTEGISIGWAKGDGNQLKNHYPKGLRR